MSLESCVACGHALAIADNSCRHCSPVNGGSRRATLGVPLYVIVAFAAVVFSILIYTLFLS